MDQAAVQRRSREIETEYLSSLADLNVNSKPLINMLTILAEENLDYAPIIVNAVEKHLAKVFMICTNCSNPRINRWELTAHGNVIKLREWVWGSLCNCARKHP